MDKIYKKFSQKSETHFETLTLNSNFQSGKISQFKGGEKEKEKENDYLKLTEIIKSWNKNLSADDGLKSVV